MEVLNIGVEEVSKMLQISPSYAYKIIRSLNAELKKQGYVVTRGKVNRKYFMEKADYHREKEE